jgi:predicted SnoaL-like aldol condensation-catalyzing enzyme
MAPSDIEKVVAVFRGIGDRDPDLAIKPMYPTKYTQHNPHASHGIDGVKEWIAQLRRENNPLEGDVLGQKVFFDIFRFEDGRIVEHRVFSTEAPLPMRVGILRRTGQLRQDGGRLSEADGHALSLGTRWHTRSTLLSFIGALSSNYQWRTRPTSTCTKSELR